MLTQNEFKLLCSLRTAGCNLSQRQLAKRSGLSLGAVNYLRSGLAARGLLHEDNTLTEAGASLLEEYRVDNAVILAAGMSSRFAPLAFEKPKGLLRVKGEILIERQIRQLQEAGIPRITLVVGYMKEKFFYLADKMGVELLINEDYYRYNNPSSLLLALDRLSNTYICSSDDYFTENVFESYVYDSYYAAVCSEAPTKEYCLTTNAQGFIAKVTVGGGPGSWYMLGHAFFSRSFSRRFAELLKAEYETRPHIRTELWEDFLRAHLKELPIRIRRYGVDMIHEFDTLDELRAFDRKYLENTDSRIFENIASALHCTEAEVDHIAPIKSGQTNTSFLFELHGVPYVYRHPDIGSSDYIRRESEFASMQAVRPLGVDDTLIAMDAKEGWKVSRYIPDAHTLNYADREEVGKALALLRSLHGARLSTGYDFDVWQETLGYIRRLRGSGREDFVGAQDLFELIQELHAYTKLDAVEPCLCHGNCYDKNFLVDSAGKLYLIDWEYSGRADPGCDYGTFICCSEYSEEEAVEILELYYGRPLRPGELRHSFAYIAIMAYYWFLWAIFLDSQDKPVGRYMYLWYRYTRQYGEKALAMYRRSAKGEDPNV